MRGRPSYKNRLKGLGDRCEVKAWIPSRTMQDIADERTQGMVQYYCESVRSMDFIRTLNALDTLARSCYMQGVNDVLEAVQKNAQEGLL